MTNEYGVIKMTKNNQTTGYVDVSFFGGIDTDINGHIRILETDDPLKAMHITPMSFDTIGGHAIKTLVEFIQKNSFKGTAVEFKTFKVEI